MFKNCLTHINEAVTFRVQDAIDTESIEGAIILQKLRDLEKYSNGDFFQDCYGDALIDKLATLVPFMSGREIWNTLKELECGFLDEKTIRLLSCSKY
jgi:hypothetical protein